MPRISLKHLNRADDAAFAAMLDGIFEHSPWIAAHAAAGRPYPGIASLHAALRQQVEQADRAARLALIRAHPELAGKAALRGQLTAASSREQKGAGLDACSADQLARLQALNRAYRKKFDFPFIVAVRGHTGESILALMAQRLENDEATEMTLALQQIYRIALLRLQDLLDEE